MTDHPCAGRFPVNRQFPATGRMRADVLAEPAEMAREEDAFWETGKASGTMYSGDHEHYAFLTEAFGGFAHAQQSVPPALTAPTG